MSLMTLTPIVLSEDLSGANWDLKKGKRKP